MADILTELCEANEYDTNAWAAIRKDAKLDMQFVKGDPWSADDKEQRKDRPSVAPEEMSQYRNQVINGLMANPRGMKFSPVGNGANDAGARFYQNKAREIEYRSHASQSYIIAADNALQRSYGFVRVNAKYASPRSANQDLWIEAFPNPDMVLPDSDALRPDSADMKRCQVKLWMPQSEFKRDYPKAKVTNFGDFSSTKPSWIQGNKILVAEHWQIRTRKRQLLLVQPPAPTAPPRQLAPVQSQPRPPLQLFKDEYEALQKRLPGVTVERELRMVDYPEVWMYLTNGLEILHEQQWPGKYIPIVSCYGKVLYVDGDTGMERVILSMTRFGRDPWKSYCYACSQELEILGQVPKASVLAAAGQLAGFEKEWNESPYLPKTWLYYHPKTAATGENIMPPPQRLAYLQGENLQALEIVKEGYRRAIQSAMGSNFLPTQAQRRNEKSGKALDKMEQAATQGTYHFVNSYEDMIRQVGVICEDLIDKIYDFRGDVGVMEPDGTAAAVRINDPDHPDSVNTVGDYLVTVSTAPSSDSEREAAADFTETLVGNIQVVAAIAGPKVAAAVFARAVRMRNLGPEGDQLADLIEPPEFKTKAGQPPAPEVVAAQQQLQALEQKLQQAEQIIKSKQAEKAAEFDGKFKIAAMQEQAESARAAADRETKMAVAELGARVDRLALFLEESHLVGARQAAAAQGAHDRAQQSIENAKDRSHEHIQSALDHARAQALADQGHQYALEQGQQAADLAPAPDQGAA